MFTVVENQLDSLKSIERLVQVGWTMLWKLARFKMFGQVIKSKQRINGPLWMQERMQQNSWEKQ